jgi:repressor LexA
MLSHRLHYVNSFCNPTETFTESNNFYNCHLMDNKIDFYRKKAGLTVQQLADKAGVSRVHLSNLKSGAKGLSLDVLKRIADALNCSPADLITENNNLKIPVIADIGAGAKIYPYDDIPLIPNGLREPDNAYMNCDTVDAPPGTSGYNVVALRVKGDSMLPFMPEGTIVYYERQAISCADNLNKLSIVALEDGSVMLKTLRKGYKYGHFNLESFNAPTIEDAMLKWCAKVTFIKPA